MRFLFVHQNFPGQFRHVASALADSPEHQVVGVGALESIRDRPILHPKIQTLAYPFDRLASAQTHGYVRGYEVQVYRAQAVARLALELKASGFSPDVMVAHPAWGEAMFLGDIFPHAKLIVYCEFFYHGTGSDLGFDPEFPSSLDDQLRVRIRNSAQLVSLEAAHAGISPTAWQRSQYPAGLQSTIQVLHEGVDSARLAPDPAAVFERDGLRLGCADEVITYVARNLEPYRGFHTFMRALPEILRARPRARVLIVGGDEVSYGVSAPGGGTYRSLYCTELKDQIDWSRVHFTGKLPATDYLKVLQISSCHVYLTYPFVLSWSLVEALSAGCAVVASDTAPVREVIRDGDNGVLTDFFDARQLAHRVATVLETPDAYRDMRHRARAGVVAQFDLTTHCLPKWVQWLTNRGEPNTP
jgi:glycosyltransferase involved in cell wall biosynthesis